MSAPLLHFDDIAFSYGTGTLLSGVSFQVEAGKSVAILGPNGVGKTTLLRLALGWLRPQGGNVLVSGRAVTEYHRRELGRVLALVPQDEHLPFDYTLTDYVLLGRTPHFGALDLPRAEDRRIAASALHTVGLSSIARRSVAVLSAGERQLLLLARAIAQAPQTMLLDEPSSHLDIGNKSRVFGLLRTLKKKGTGLLFTTHDPQFALNLADRVVVLKEGHVVAMGEPKNTITSEILTQTYAAPVEIVDTPHGRAVFWGSDG